MGLHSANIIKIFRILKIPREQKKGFNNLYTEQKKQQHQDKTQRTAMPLKTINTIRKHYKKPK